MSDILALNRTVGVVLLTVLFFGLGEQLWSPFLPAYLDASAKSAARTAGSMAAVDERTIWAVGVYAFLRNLFEAFCYVVGGRLTAWLGDRGSLLLFGGTTIFGYLLFLSSPSPVVAILAALLIMGWDPLSVPVTFTTVGATVKSSRQGMAFALQSIQKRLPKIIGPFLAGLALTWAEARRGIEAGRIEGTRWLVMTALGLGLVSLLIQWRFMPLPVARASSQGGTWRILRELHPLLRRLLLAEVFTRWCDWLIREFIVLYLILGRGASTAFVGTLFLVQNLTALLTYLPIGRMTEVVGGQPFIGLTFLFFAAFPLALAVVPDGWGLVLAFVVYGLREVGEPARKALITGLIPPEVRARGVGLYWGVRSFSICSASLAGAWVWLAVGPQGLLHAAFAAGVAGAVLYYVLCRNGVDSVSRPSHAP